MSYTTPPRPRYAGSLRDQLQALESSPNPVDAAQSQAADARQRDREFRSAVAAQHSPGGRGEDAGAVDLVSLFGASGRQFIPGPGIPGRALARYVTQESSPIDLQPFPSNKFTQ